MTRSVLFLCSGNYYRSRFAEILFNHLARELDLPWRAESRGIVAAASRNPGPISEYALAGLNARKISPGAPRDPLQLTEADLARAARIIALYRVEHAPMLERDFPHWAKRVEYWDVPDLGEMEAEQALARIEERVRTLVEQLAASPQSLAVVR